MGDRVYKQKEKFIYNALRVLVAVKTPYVPAEKPPSPVKPETIRKYAKEVEKWCRNNDIKRCPVKTEYRKGKGGRVLTIEVDRERAEELMRELRQKLVEAASDPFDDELRDKLRKRRNRAVKFLVDVVADPKNALKCVNTADVVSDGCKALLAILDAVTDVVNEDDETLSTIFVKKYNRSKKYRARVERAKKFFSSLI